MADMSYKEAIEIFNEVLGRVKSWEGTALYNTGIVLYHDVQKERQAIEMAIALMEKADSCQCLKVVGSCS